MTDADDVHCTVCVLKKTTPEENVPTTMLNVQFSRGSRVSSSKTVEASEAPLDGVNRNSAPQRICSALRNEARDVSAVRSASCEELCLFDGASSASVGTAAACSSRLHRMPRPAAVFTRLWRPSDCTSATPSSSFANCTNARAIG